MFGGGWTEMLIIGIVALVVIGPKDLPVVMRKVGRVVGTIRRMGGEFQRELNKTTGLDQIADLRRSITEPLRQTSEEIAREFNRQTESGVEPTGVIKPADPAVESVYEQIAATAGVPATEVAAPAAPPVMKPLAAGGTPPVPAPAETVVLPGGAKPRVARPARARSAAPASTAPAGAAPDGAASDKPAPKRSRRVGRTAAETAAAVPPAPPAPVEAVEAPRRRRRPGPSVAAVVTATERTSRPATPVDQPPASLAGPATTARPGAAPKAPRARSKKA